MSRPVRIIQIIISMNTQILSSNAKVQYVDTVGTLDPEFLKPLLNCVLGELGVVLDEFQIVRRQLLA